MEPPNKYMEVIKKKIMEQYLNGVQKPNLIDDS